MSTVSPYSSTSCSSAIMSPDSAQLPPDATSLDYRQRIMTTRHASSSSALDRSIVAPLEGVGAVGGAVGGGGGGGRSSRKHRRQVCILYVCSRYFLWEYNFYIFHFQVGSMKSSEDSYQTLSSHSLGSACCMLLIPSLAQVSPLALAGVV